MHLQHDLNGVQKKRLFGENVLSISIILLIIIFFKKSFSLSQIGIPILNELKLKGAVEIYVSSNLSNFKKVYHKILFWQFDLKQFSHCQLRT